MPHQRDPTTCMPASKGRNTGIPLARGYCMQTLGALEPLCDRTNDWRSERFRDKKCWRWQWTFRGQCHRIKVPLVDLNSSCSSLSQVHLWRVIITSGCIMILILNHSESSPHHQVLPSPCIPRFTLLSMSGLASQLLGNYIFAPCRVLTVTRTAYRQDLEP